MLKRKHLLSLLLTLVLFLQILSATSTSTVATTLHEKCPYSEFPWSVFFRIRTERSDLQCKSPYSVRMRESTDEKNSEYGHYLYSDYFLPLKQNL